MHIDPFSEFHPFNYLLSFMSTPSILQNSFSFFKSFYLLVLSTLSVTLTAFIFMILPPLIFQLLVWLQYIIKSLPIKSLYLSFIFKQSTFILWKHFIYNKQTNKA